MRRIPARYVVALIVGSLIIGVAVAFVHVVRRGLEERFEHFKEDLQAKKAAGTLPREWQGVDLESLDISQVKMRIPTGQQYSLNIAAVLGRYWYILIPLVFAMCLGAAVVFGRLRSALVRDPNAN